MRILKKVFAINVIVILIFASIACEKINETVPQATCSKGLSNHPRATRYQKLVDDILKIGTPGISISVISPEGTWSNTGGKADLKNNVKLTPCHILRLGSVSKVFCATMIMKLQDEGKLSINDKANKYVSAAIIDKIPNGNDVTIKQLLTHQTGIPEYSNLDNNLKILNLSIVKQSAEQNLLSLSGKKTTSKAGDELLYSNSNYLLLALIIKSVSGKSANVAIKEKTLTPLGLENIFMSDEKPANLARGYYDVNDNGLMLDRTEIDNNAVGGEDMLDGGVMANSFDLATFFNALITGKILSAKALAQMQEFNTVTQDLGDLSFIKGYGLGLMRLETDHGIAIGHYGTVHSFNSMVFYFPVQKLTLAVARNGDSAKIKKFIESKEFFNYLFEDK